MSGDLGRYSVLPSSVIVPLVALTGAFTPTVGLLWLGSRWLRGRRYRRRAARLDLRGAGRWERQRRRCTARASATDRFVGGGAARPGKRARPRRLRLEAVVSLLAGVATPAVIPGAIGWPAGLLIAAVLWRWLPTIRDPMVRSAAREQSLLLAQLPLTADLLAAFLESSASPAQAAGAVARTIGGPMEVRLTAVAAELSLGAPPVACWDRLGEKCPALAPLARCLVRTTVSGAPPAVPLAGLAASQRAAAARAAHARVRRAGVLATAPLGLCFLPAFVLIGIVPVVMGLVASFARQT